MQWNYCQQSRIQPGTEDSEWELQCQQPGGWEHGQRKLCCPGSGPHGMPSFARGRGSSCCSRCCSDRIAWQLRHNAARSTRAQAAEVASAAAAAAAAARDEDPIPWRDQRTWRAGEPVVRRQCVRLAGGDASHPGGAPGLFVRQADELLGPRGRLSQGRGRQGGTWGGDSSRPSGCAGAAGEAGSEPQQGSAAPARICQPAKGGCFAQQQQRRRRQRQFRQMWQQQQQWPASSGR